MLKFAKPVEFSAEPDTHTSVLSSPLGGSETTSAVALIEMIEKRKAELSLEIEYQRVGRLSMYGWRRRAIYAILKQKPYNFTNTLKAYLSA